MREIKFRAWHVDSKEYCEGSISDMFQWIEDGQNVLLEQFTGLTDKNGVEIYAGDIVKTYRGNFEVDHPVPYVDLVNWESIDYYNQDEPVFLDWSEFEVIGNIHQNPEILK